MRLLYSTFQVRPGCPTFFNFYDVWNVEQTQGLEAHVPAGSAREFVPIERAEKIAAGMAEHPHRDDVEGGHVGKEARIPAMCRTRGAGCDGCCRRRRGTGDVYVFITLLAVGQVFFT